MKKIILNLLLAALFFSTYSQNAVVFSDPFIRNHDLTSDDFSKLHVYVVFVNNDEHYNILTTPNVVNIGNIKLKNFTRGVIISSNYKPGSKCKVNVDIGNDTIITFFRYAGGNDFNAFVDGIRLMLFTDDIIEKPTPDPKEVIESLSKVSSNPFNNSAIKSNIEYIEGTMMLTKALYNVKSKYRKDLMDNLLPAIQVLSDSEVVRTVGKIISIKIRCKSKKSNEYVDAAGNNLGQTSDNEIECSIKLQNLNYPLSDIQKAGFDFVYNSYSEFYYHPKLFQLKHLLEPVFTRLSQISLGKIAITNKSSIIRLAAIEKITNPYILEYIAKNVDEIESIREEAQKRLNFYRKR